MVLSAKKTIQHVPSKGKMSIRKIQNFTVHKRQSVIRAVYGVLLVVISIVMAAVDPIKMFTSWITEIHEGRFLYNMWKDPTYEIYSDVYIFNYTNVNQYLSGDDPQMELKEIGPFRFQEIRKNENLTVDRERGVMTMNPTIKLKFLPEQSIAHYKDVPVTVPSIALIAVSTLLADNLGYLVNVGAYYSIQALGSKLFRNMTVEELMWGYDDPIVSIASKLLPGWIDFGKIGIMDRFYAERKELAEVELKNLSRKYSINTWNHLPGLAEQGFTTLNTSVPCNRVKGTYEGMMLTPNLNKDLDIPVFRRQACRVYPFKFFKEMTSDSGIHFYRYLLEDNAFNKNSSYACPCTHHCLPDGFVDISSCYYGFPIALSKPHFLNTDPEQQSYFRGFSTDPTKYTSLLDVEPMIGAPLKATVNIQINIAVRTSSGNPITKPVKDKVLPLLWLSMYCKEAPQAVLKLLALRLVIGPPLLITLEVILLLIGMFLGIQGFHRLWRPKYTLVAKEDSKPKKSIERRISSVILNMTDNSGFVDDQELAKEAVSLLAITVDDCDGDMPDLLMND